MREAWGSSIGRRMRSFSAASPSRSLPTRSPQNVILTPGGRAKVLDFGLAKAAGTSGAAALDLRRDMSSFVTREGLIVGTLPYLGHRNFRFLDPASGQETRLFEREDGWVFSPRYSPDGSRLALYRNRPSHGPDSPLQRGPMVIDLERGSEATVIDEQLADPVGWSPDGKWVYAHALDGVSLFMVPSTGGQPRVTSLPFESDSVSMTPDGRLVAGVRQVQSDVWLMDGFDADED